MSIRIERLSEKNFADYEALTCKQAHGGCYCSFWHQKWQSMADWQKCQKETPERNRQIVFEKMRSGFHVGVLAYEDSEAIAWLSVGPLTDFYWTWRRVAQVGEDAKSIAGITCFTISSAHRGKGLQTKILDALKVYGRDQGWKSIEGYPFDTSAIEKHKQDVIWPGLTKGFERAGFRRTGPHWLNNSDAERSIFTTELTDLNVTGPGSSAHADTFQGMIIEESLQDPSIINSLNVSKVEIAGPSRWHIYSVLVQKSHLNETQTWLKKGPWYMHFWSGDCLIVIFPKKVFELSRSDKSTWMSAIEFGRGLGIPDQQLDFLTPEET